jgi:hypothetical protein
MQFDIRTPEVVKGSANLVIIGATHDTGFRGDKLARGGERP